MTVKDTLYSSLIRYSTIYENKWQVFEHLFSTYGNGYQWVDGELVEIDSSNCEYNESLLRNIPERVKNEAEDFTPVFHTWFLYRLESDRRKFAEENYVNYLKVLEIIGKKDGCSEKYTISKNEYVEKYAKMKPEKKPLFSDSNYSFKDYLKDTQCVEYSYVYNYPEDIKPDWAEARQEWENYLRSVGCWLKD